MKKYYILIFALLWLGSEKGYTQGNFDSLSNGMTSHGAYVLALGIKDTAWNSPIYAGGNFSVAGRTASRNIAEWSCTNDSITPIIGKWNPLGKGIDSDVCALEMYGKYLYAGGKFDSAGSISCSRIARWDTALLKWDSLVGKLNGTVYALCVFNNKLYAGGDFTIADGDTVNRIAAWNDTVWSPVGKGFDSGSVYALAVSNDSLYAGGSFLKSNGATLNHIAKLSDSIWKPVGNGTNNTVYALTDFYLYGDVLVVGGAFTESGGIPTNYVSYYNQSTSTWDSIGGGVNDTVMALDAGSVRWGLYLSKKVSQGLGGGPYLMVGGCFDSADRYPCNHLATWFGDYPYTLGSAFGFSGPVYAIANAYNGLDFGSGNNYVGGEFKDQLGYFNEIIDTLNNIAYVFANYYEGLPNISDGDKIVVYPNPSTGIFTIQLSVVSSQWSVEVYNVLGEEVYNGMLKPVQHDYEINLSAQPNGVYFYRVVGLEGEVIGSGKLVVQK